MVTQGRAQDHDLPGGSLQSVRPLAAARPCWTDLACTHLETTTAFYASVLGWDFTPPVDQLGGYRDAVVDGQRVASIYSLGDEEVPATWLTYFSVSDADRALRQSLLAGAVPVMPVSTLNAQTRVAVVAAPGQLMVGWWEAARELRPVIAPGAPCWFEAITPDLNAAQQFFASTLGVRLERDRSQGIDFATALAPEPSIAPLVSDPLVLAAGREEPVFGLLEGEPAAPLNGLAPYFLSVDVDAAVRRAEAAGGMVTLPPTDAPMGRYAFLLGPDQEPFTVLQPRR